MNLGKLSKVLALVDSHQDGEALAALRAARLMLNNAGLAFQDLAMPSLTTLPEADEERAMAYALMKSLRLQIQSLESQLSRVTKEAEDARADAEKWRMTASAADQSLSRSRAEAERWRLLAKETAEQLWDMGQMMTQSKDTSRRLADRRLEIGDYLRAPETAHWSDREIARRVGVSPQTVANWRRKLQDDGQIQVAERLVRRGAVTYPMHVGTIGRSRAGTSE
jgi:transposase-like protein